MIARCPTCKARFDGGAQCRRCGADLSPLMRTLKAAWLLRARARSAVEAAYYIEAAAAARRSLELEDTREGRRLLALTTVLAQAEE